MSRKRLDKFRNPKMISSRIEKEDAIKFETILEYRDNLTLQDFMNLAITEYISGNLYLSGTKFQIRDTNEQ